MRYISYMKESYNTKKGFLIITICIMIFCAIVFTLLAMLAANCDITKLQFTVVQKPDNEENFLGEVS